MTKAAADLRERGQAVDVKDVSDACNKAVFFTRAVISVEQSAPGALQAKTGMRPDEERVPAVYTQAIHVYRRICPIVGVEASILGARIPLAGGFLGGSRHLAPQGRRQTYTQHNEQETLQHAQ